MSLGKKMNLLYEMAQGEYIAVMNDDDIIPDNYIHLMLKGCDSGLDVISGKIWSGHINNKHPITIEEYMKVPGIFQYHSYQNVLPAKAHLVKKYSTWVDAPAKNSVGQDLVGVNKIMATNPTVYRTTDVFYYHCVGKDVGR